MPGHDHPSELGDVVVAMEGIEPTAAPARRDGAVERLDRFLARGYAPPASARSEARLIAAGRWLLNDRPDHPVIPVWAARVPHVLAMLDDDRLAALLARFSFEYSIRIGDFGEAGRLVAQMWDRTATNAEARLAWLPAAALFLWLTGRPDAALATLLPLLDDERTEPVARFALLEQAASAALVAGHAARSAAYLDRAEALALELSAHEVAHIWFLRAGVAAVAGRLDEAAAAIGHCEARAREVEARFSRALWRLGGSLVRLKAGQARRAERELSDLLGDVTLMRAGYLEWSVRLARAAARLALQRPSPAEADLAAALRIAARNGYVCCGPWGLTPHLRALLDLAVERGIEGRTARSILAQHA